ncbi:MAG TPA: GNAT family N-acetyltransferase [Acidimicrobiia bacterium]|nr:GNAT family N-acetyltransferase [Acidimicrobiia bacterium]
MADVIECDPDSLWSIAGAWLASEPVLHNVVATVVRRAIETPSPYGDASWYVVVEAGEPVGAAIMTPPFHLGLTPMSHGPLTDLADALVDRLPTLPGVSGPGDVALRFAELWCRRTGAKVEPGMEQLMYRLDTVVPPPPAGGKLRLAAADDRRLLCEWFEAFTLEAGAVSGDIAKVVDRRLAERALYLWEHSTVLTMAGVAPPVGGVVRVGPVYTPPEMRRRGYASNCVAALSQQALDDGATACMLFTDRANATSNVIYQRIGYRLVTTASACHFRYGRS